MTGDGKISTQDLTLNPNLLTVVVGKVQNNLFKAVVGKVQGGEGREGVESGAKNRTQRARGGRGLNPGPTAC